MILGRVDEVDGSFIATNFVAGAVPTKSLYITGKGAARMSSTSALGPIEVKTDMRSIGLGYARAWLPGLAAAVLVLDVVVTHDVHVVTVLFVLVAIAGAVLATRAGKLDEKEKARLRLLGTVTGLRIQPWKLTDATRATKRDSLGDLMEKGGIPITPEGIISVIDDIPMPAMALVYGFCCYAGDEPEWRECAEIIYQRHESAAEV